MADFTNNQTYTQPFFRSLRSESPQAVIDDRVSRRGDTPTFGFPTDTPKYYTLLWEHVWGSGTANSAIGSVTNTYGDATNPGRLNSFAAYRLPLPTHIIDNHEVHYDSEFNWFEILGGISRAFNAFTNWSGSFSVNNFKNVSLLSPQFRTYAYEWKLHPKNASESRMIRSIYHGIKRGMHPTRFDSKLAFRFPHVFFLGFYPNADMLPKFKPAVITSCLVDYQGNNPAPTFYRETEAPESIILRLSFLELEVWISENFRNAAARTPGSPADPFDSTDWFTIAQ